jgi:AcrR family transcriptional regulator
MADALKKPEGLREHKKRRTHQRIAEVGLNLFLANGYDATTLDEIAAAAGISRRTFFSYFKSKDEILLAQLSCYVDALKLSVHQDAACGARPADIARDALLRFARRFQSPHAKAIARLLRGNEVLQARGAGGYQRLQRLENALHEGLRELWPEQERSAPLRIVAMASITVLRFAIEGWFQEDCNASLEKYVEDAFEHLKAEI